MDAYGKSRCVEVMDAYGKSLYAEVLAAFLRWHKNGEISQEILDKTTADMERVVRHNGGTDDTWELIQRGAQRLAEV